MRKIDLTNRKFGKLTVIEKTEERKSGSIVWICTCECGKSQRFSSRQLKQGYADSCGCLKEKLTVRRIINPRQTKCKYGTAFHSLISDYQKAARNRNYEFNLTQDEFFELSQQKCFYCNQRPTQKISNRSINYPCIFTYNGIDRKDNTKGYVSSNCVPCCGVCNKMKGVLSHDIFLHYIKLIAETHLDF